MLRKFESLWSVSGECDKVEVRCFVANLDSHSNELLECWVDSNFILKGDRWQDSLEEDIFGATSFTVDPVGEHGTIPAQ